MSHVAVVGAIALGLCGAACGNSPAPPPVPTEVTRTSGHAPAAPAVAPRLVSEDEIARLRAAVDAAIAHGAAAHCPRPLLHGAAAPGTAEEALVALVESPELAECARTSGTGLADSLRLCGPDASPASGLTTPCRARALEDPRSLEGHVLDSFLACQPLDDAIARVVAHDDACSPYRPGGRERPSSFRQFLALSRGVEVRGRHLAQEGQTRAALALLFDWLLVCQDLGRGGAGFVPSSIGTAAMAGPLAQIETILAENALTPADQDAVIASVDALLAGEPAVTDVLEGERLDMIATGILPGLDGRAAKASPSPIPTQSFAADPRDETALGWIALEESAQAERAACPATATLRACVGGLQRVAQEAEQNLTSPAPITAHPPAEVSRAHAVRVLRGTAPGVRVPLVQRLAFRRAQLAALRLHLEVLRIASRDGDGACPPLSALGTAPLRTLLEPAALGDTLVATTAPGAIDVTLPSWIAPVRVWTIRCPAIAGH